MRTEHFFIVGAQRSGTTHLYHLCDEHPEIVMAKPVKPEPKFFIHDSLFRLGKDYYKKKYFQETDKAKILGEKSTSYIEIEQAAERISQTFPSAKIIFLLRNPITRAVSNYWFSVDNGFETLAMEKAFREEENRWQNYDASKISVSPFAYLRRGRYLQYIAMYEKYFPAEQIHIMIHERLVKTAQPLRSLYSFLGVDQNFFPTTLHKIVNANKNKPKIKLDPELEKYMREYFEDYNLYLAQRLGDTLLEWQ